LKRCQKRGTGTLPERSDFWDLMDLPSSLFWRKHEDEGWERQHGNEQRKNWRIVIDSKFFIFIFVFILFSRTSGGYL
jgi:hypothetical protein